MTAIVAIRMLSGQISTRGLLASAKSTYDPERLVLLIGTFVAAGYYIALCLPLLTQENIKALPAVPEEVFFLLGGSQIGYLTGKRLRMDQS